MKGFIKKIEQINFGLMSPDDIREMSVVTVETPDTYEDDGFPIEKGLMDPRLGVIDPSLVCRTCGFRGGDCQGHFGSIELARPVIHIGFGDVIHKILRSTCNNCAKRYWNSSSVSPGKPAMKVERIVKSGQIFRQAWMRSSVFSVFAGRFISFKTRGWACWNGTSKYGRIKPSAINSTT